VNVGLADLPSGNNSILALSDLSSTECATSGSDEGCAMSFGHSNVVSAAGVGVFLSTMIHLILGCHPLFFRG
jgi:hypothetical protein